MEVIIFSLSNCFHCKDLKMKLNNVKISFKDFDIHEDKLFWDEIVKQTGANLVPTICLFDNDNKKTHFFVPDKDFKNGDEAIDIIKKYTL